jgi:hypothetical protein
LTLSPSEEGEEEEEKEEEEENADMVGWQPRKEEGQVIK